MAGRLKLAEQESLPVVYISGRMTVELGQSLIDLYDTIALEKRKRVLLDFSQVEYINSAGLAILINLVSRAQEEGHQVDLVALQDAVLRLIEIVGLTEFVTIYPSLKSAFDPLPA